MDEVAVVMIKYKIPSFIVGPIKCNEPRTTFTYDYLGIWPVAFTLNPNESEIKAEKIPV